MGQTRAGAEGKFPGNNATAKGVKIPETERASPSPGGEGGGEGERFL